MGGVKSGGQWEARNQRMTSCSGEGGGGHGKWAELSGRLPLRLLIVIVFCAAIGWRRMACLRRPTTENLPRVGRVGRVD
ncbi:hypothetical protein RRG08_028707 [Elysia crispata]|uniref:Uncharacterized protein n=1 Tax=Elysia crispata TaxID=231223 RepID=A0AAE1CJ75_9GAST|nr:hypothetical protein RRG08_028707 [Elysia crispata]